MNRVTRLIARLGITSVAIACTSFASATDLSDAFDRVEPAVLIIEAYKHRPGSDVDRPSRAAGLGSGVLISNDGQALTASHLVQTADSIHVQFVNGDQALARVIASEPMADVALIQLSNVPEGIDPVVLADSDTVRVGEEVFVVGAPYGISHTLTVGHISARRPADSLDGGFGLGEYLQTDAAINQGNSGGPLFNLDGQLIGIVSHIESTSGGNEGLGFAVASNTVRDQLLAHKRRWSGLEGRYIRGPLAAALNIPQSAGILVQRVARGSLSERLGLREGSIEITIDGDSLLLGGDVILEVEGVPIAGRQAYLAIRQRMSDKSPSDPVRLIVFRGGERVELTSPACADC
jgi:S1-C subfamily serine protease